ncbi:hypothetical protein XBO1_2100012 [Xenorhabdus bovienii str. oregonense]|uniref:Uncharacterized protein n=1 Tax=Xenorhabdus bovienii str. oregonense TaxID=1398202 RepID=A0A077NUR3_XENBV|nr:hypothetical protein XBO1_2100012 [Xenorhabdus bovienii str. oregonense]
MKATVDSGGFFVPGSLNSSLIVPKLKQSSKTMTGYCSREKLR